MKLPRADSAIVDDAKVRDYLLSPEHPVGRFKAVFFGALSYRRDQWQQLREDLLDLGRSGTTEKGSKTQFGQKYEVRGILQGPSGGRAQVVTAWIVLNDEESPRFLTAFPEEAR
jgi:hypothetical protein